MLRGNTPRASDPLGPVYARSRDRERVFRRLAVGSLTLFAALLACRPATPPPDSLPTPTAERRAETTAPPSVDRLLKIEDEKVVVPPIETEDLLPIQERQATPAEVPNGPLELRVGLATDLDRITLPCCDPRIQVLAGEQTLALDQPITIAPADGVAGTVSYRLQVAALKDEQQAHGAAERLHEATGEPAEAVFDADTDLYRVRLGRFADRASAEAMRQTHPGLGLAKAWVVTEGGDLTSAAMVVRQRDRVTRVEGRWLEIVAPDDVGIPWERTRYRGSLLVFLNGRGGLNVVNEIELETYLRGVVPKEMGPELYDRIEAIKAQTVAARTYTLRHLGEFTDEGYDICSTPRCQVYGGMAVEHPVSDRAIRETAGQVVLFDGEPAQTFYSATCGGHTENVEVVFPLKSGDYLKGVPCTEAGVTSLQGDLELPG
ncbi:MAG: SpoIID/LytB domain-containing protein, partial [Acidobacteriota bacterium]